MPGGLLWRLGLLGSEVTEEHVRPELLSLVLGWAWYLPASEATQQAAEVVGSPLARQGMIPHTARRVPTSSPAADPCIRDDWSGLNCYF